MNKLLRNVGLVLVAGALVGCSNEKVRNMMDQRIDETKKGLQEAQQPAPKRAYNPLTISDKVWAGNTVMRMSRGLPLPSKYETPRGVTIIAGDTVPLSEIANMISNQTGIPVRIAPGTEGGGFSKSTPSSAGPMGSASAASAPSGMPIAYEGPLGGLLDQVCGYYGINWRYDGASIGFSRFETRVFMIEALPGSLSIKDGMKDVTASSSSGGSTGGSTASSTNDLQQSSEMTVELKVWEELEKTINALLAGTGNSVVAPSSGTVTVTTTPEIMRTVAKFVEAENKRLSKQVAINVEIYTVDLSDETDFTVSLTAAMDKLSSMSYSTAAAPTMTTTGLGKLGITVLSSKQGTLTSALQALSTIGDTTRVAQFPLTTLNNRPVSRRVGKDKSYVASISNSQSTSASYSTSTVTPGTIQEGFSLQMTPRVLDDGRIMLQYSFSLVDLVSLKNFSTSTGSTDTTTSSSASNSYIQLPETSNRVFVQQSLLKSGSTLIIGGFDDEQATQASQGVGSAYNYLFGGGSSSATTRTMLFIAITPQILEVPRSEQGE